MFSKRNSQLLYQSCLFFYRLGHKIQIVLFQVEPAATWHYLVNQILHRVVTWIHVNVAQFEIFYCQCNKLQSLCNLSNSWEQKNLQNKMVRDLIVKTLASVSWIYSLWQMPEFHCSKFSIWIYCYLSSVFPINQFMLLVLYLPRYLQIRHEILVNSSEELYILAPWQGIIKKLFYMLQLFTGRSEMLLQAIIVPACSPVFLQFCVCPGMTTGLWAVETSV